MQVASFKHLDPADLLPQAWAERHPDAYVFNPTIASHGGVTLLCYRVVEENLGRRIAFCRLDDKLAPIPGSAVPFSDHVKFAVEGLDERNSSWHADPRLFSLSRGLFVTWNDGLAKPLNNQFIAEVDPLTGLPLGPARRLTETRPQTNHEKNWMLFEAGDELYCLYSIEPHRVLKLKEWGEEEVVFESSDELRWNDADYRDAFGELRGGAQPVRIGDEFYNFCHSCYRIKGKRHYVGALYTFSAKPPFKPLRMSPTPLPLPNPGSDRPRLNSAAGDVVYPCGAHFDGSGWLVTYGLNDESSGFAVVPGADLEQSLRPVPEIDQSPPRHDVSPEAEAAAVAEGNILLEQHLQPVPLFYWSAKGLLKGGPESQGERFAIGNFGDEASREIVERITGRSCYFADDKSRERRLLSIGSVLHRARNGDTVWGSGVKGSAAALAPDVKELSVHALRGPISYDFLRRRGFDLSKVTHLFDPAVVITGLDGEWIAEQRLANPQRRAFGIVPHFKEEAIYKKLYPQHVDRFITPDGNLRSVISELLKYDLILSGSLHGIIVSEALGIPAIWLRPQAGEDPLKYYDYYLGTDRHRILCADTVEDALRLEPMALPSFNVGEMLATFPMDFVEGLRPTMAPGERVHFGSSSKAFLMSRIAAQGLYPAQEWGAWTEASGASLVTQVRNHTPGLSRVRLALKPFNPAKLPEPQAMDVLLNGQLVLSHTWEAGVSELQTFDLPLDRVGPDGLINVQIRTKVHASMSSLGFKGDNRVPGVGLVNMGVV